MLSVARPVATEDAKSVLRFGIGVTGHRNSDEFYQGEPICGNAGIRRQNTGETTMKSLLRVGTKDLPWYENVTFTVHKTEELPAEPAKKNEIGDDEVPADAAEKKVLLRNVKVELLEYLTSKKHELRVNQMVNSTWAISPDVTSKLPAGKYVIQAVFDTTDKRESHPKILHVRLVSNEVTIVVNEPPKDGSAKAEILKAQARYLQFQRKYDDVIRLLEQVRRIDPARKDIYSHLGRAYELQGNLESAIREYRAYVNWARKQPRTGKGGPHDHADAIESTIKALEKKLSNKK